MFWWKVYSHEIIITINVINLSIIYYCFFLLAFLVYWLSFRGKSNWHNICTSIKFKVYNNIVSQRPYIIYQVCRNYIFCLAETLKSLGQHFPFSPHHSESHSVKTDTLQPHGMIACQDPRAMEFSRQECWSSSLPLLQGIFPTQRSNQSPLHCRWILSQLLYQRSLFFPQSLEINNLISF